MYACHSGAKYTAKVHPCQACLNTLIIKGLWVSALRKRNMGSIPIARSKLNGLMELMV